MDLSQAKSFGEFYFAFYHDALNQLLILFIYSALWLDQME